MRKSRWLGPALGVGFGGAATALGAPGWGTAAANWGGNFLGDVIKTVTGLGAYNVRSNALYEGAQVPFVRNESSHGVVISHREYLMDVVSSGTAGEFQVQTLPLNPGLPYTFPFLSQIAANFSEYVLEGCLLCFKSTSGDALNSVNTALGTVLAATQYNSYEEEFTSKAEMESHQYTTACKPSSDMIHPIECDPGLNAMSQFFVRTTSTSSSQDLRLSDLGKFSIATVGFQGTNVTCGELWITYQVSLLKPRLWTNLGRSLAYYHMWNPTGANITTSTPFGTGSDFTIAERSSAEMSWDSANNTMYFPRRSYPARYFFVYRIAGGGTASIAYPNVTYAYCSALNHWQGVASVIYAPNGGTTSSVMCHFIAIQSIGGYFQPRVTLSTGPMVLPASPSSAEVMCEELPA